MVDHTTVRSEHPLKALTWNVEWASPRSPRRAEILARIDEHAPDLICLTETHAALLGSGGHTIHSQADFGYRLVDGRRKALLWSREPWLAVDDFGDELMPPGRFIAGTTRAPLGDVDVIGVCIPWSGSRTHPSSSPRRRMWQDHHEYVERLGRFLEGRNGRRLIVLGDFNRRNGGGVGISQIQAALNRTKAPGLNIVTSDLEFNGRKTIDHIALGAGLHCESVKTISNLHGDRKLSDHFGVAATIVPREPDE